LNRQMKWVRVPRLEAEAVRHRLNKRHAVRKDVWIEDEGAHVFLPLVAGMEYFASGLEIVEREGRPRYCYRSPLEHVLDIVDIREELKPYLPHKWEMLGDVLIMRIPAELEPVKEKVAAAYAAALPVKTVCEEVGIIKGPFRTPDVRVIFGTETETEHLENGILYKLDTARVMFSSGNFQERKRMGELDCRGETVVDMFAGIGYFSLPLAMHAHAERVVACEINPVAYSYLVHNIRLNGAGTIEPLLGDNRNLTGERFADRVLMGFVGTTEQFLPKAFCIVKEGGVVHYHEVCPIDLLPDRPIQRIHEAAEESGRAAEILSCREVKSFGPATSHVVIDFQAG
jgi:tRNA wybutosine-synthesizing protein 2